jgi:hypothetical protein
LAESTYGGVVANPRIPRSQPAAANTIPPTNRAAAGRLQGARCLGVPRPGRRHHLTAAAAAARVTVATNGTGANGKDANVAISPNTKTNPNESAGATATHSNVDPVGRMAR